MINDLLITNMQAHYIWGENPSFIFHKTQKSFRLSYLPILFPFSIVLSLTHKNQLTYLNENIF